MRCTNCGSGDVDRLASSDRTATVIHCNGCGHTGDYVPNCGKPPPIRMWFSACVAPYGHGGDCRFDPLPALTETEGICETCGNDRVAWDRLRAEVGRLRTAVDFAGRWMVNDVTPEGMRAYAELLGMISPDRAVQDRLRAENVDLADRLSVEKVYSQHLKSLLAEAMPWWEEEGSVDPECADLVARIRDAIE